MKTIIRKQQTFAEALLDAAKHSTIDKSEIIDIASSCDFDLLKNHYGIHDLYGMILLALHNKNSNIKVYTIVNKFAKSTLSFSAENGKGHLTDGRYLTEEELNQIKDLKDTTIFNLYTIPAGKIWEKSTTFAFDQKIDCIELSLKKGDVITIDNDFIVSKDSTLKIYGDISELTGMSSDANGNELSKGYHFVYDYKVLHDDIDGVHYKTYTDIGGTGLYINGEEIVHLHNGFGDGRYTMRFSKGQLVR